MARLFDDAASQFMESIGYSIIPSMPFTMAAWFSVDSIALNQTIMSLGNHSTGTNNEYRLVAGGVTAGDPVLADTLNGGTYGVAASTSGYSANTWHHGAAVFSSTTSRAAYIDGGSKGTNATSVGAASVDILTIGSDEVRAGVNRNYLGGAIMEAAIWDVALTDQEIAILGRGYSPLFVRPQSILSYYPITGRGSPEIDIVNGQDMGWTAGGIYASHYKIIYPSYPQVGLTISPAGAIMPQFQYANLGASLYNGTLIG